MDDKNETISKYYFESITTKLERTIERLWIIIILLILVNASLIIYDKWKDSQYEDVITTVTQELDTVSGNAIINDGVHINDGESETDSNNKETN